MRNTIQDSILTFNLEAPQPKNLSTMAAEPQSQCFCLFLGVVYSGIEYSVHYIVVQYVGYMKAKGPTMPASLE